MRPLSQAFCVLALSGAQVITPPPSPGRGVIAGTVVDGVSGRPIADAVVTLTGPGDVAPRVMASPEGSFVFTNVPGGRYQLTAEKFGYVRGSFGRTHPSASPLSIDLAADEQFIDGSIALWKFASISGRVVDEYGEPLVGVAVEMLPTQSGPVVTTDDRGAYRLFTLRPGSYIVMVAARVTTVPIEAVRERSDVGLGGAAVSATALGDPWNVQVGDSALISSNRSPIPLAPRADGRLLVYETTFYPAARSRSQAQAVSVVAGEERTGVDIQLRPVPASTVSGRLMGPDGPLARTTVRLVRADASGALEDFGYETASAQTDANGGFTALGVPAGAYSIRVLAPQIAGTGTRPGAPPALWANDAITVGGADTTDLVVRARIAPRLTARVVVKGDRVLPPESFELIVQAIDPGPFRVVNPRLDREYRFSTQIAPGRYLIAAYPSTGSWCTSVSVAGVDFTGEPLTIAEADVPDLMIECGGEPTRLTGTVRNARGDIDTRATVVAFSVDIRHWAGAVSQPQRLVNARVSASGTFALANLPPGEYFVSTIPDETSPSWQDPAVLAALSRSATRVTLKAGETRVVNLRSGTLRVQ